MHAVVETHAFRRAAHASNVSEDERQEIILTLAQNPAIGDIIPGTGGARKVRFAARGKGKSGGYRVITFYSSEDVPIFLLDVYAKGDRVNLTQTERNELKTILATLADEWKRSAARKWGPTK